MKKIAGQAGIVLLIILLLVLIYGVFFEPYIYDIEEEAAIIPGLSSAWEGKKIAVISDFQVGMRMANTATIRRVVLRLIEERPEAVLILGDFVYHAVDGPDQEVQQVIDLVRPLTESNIPVFAVLGNHDYAMTGEEDAENEQMAGLVRASLEEIGVQVLHNRAVRLNSEVAEEGGSTDSDSGIYIVGLGAEYPDEDHPEVALSQIPQNAPRLVMMHHPDTFGKLPAGSAPIAVAGHTHGGQIRLPFTPEWSWLTFATEEEVHSDGWIDGYGEPGNRLYVNRGIGFSKVPVRINCPPEITLFTLQASDSKIE